MHFLPDTIFVVFRRRFFLFVAAALGWAAFSPSLATGQEWGNLLEEQQSLSSRQERLALKLRAELRERSKHNRLVVGAIEPASAVLCSGAGTSAIRPSSCGFKSQRTATFQTDESIIYPDEYRSFQISQASKQEDLEQGDSERGDSEQTRPGEESNANSDWIDELMFACDSVESSEDLALVISEVAQCCEQQPGGKQIERVLTKLAIRRFESVIKMQLIEQQLEMAEVVQNLRVEIAEAAARLESHETLMELAEEALGAVFSFAEASYAQAVVQTRRSRTSPEPAMVSNPYAGPQRAPASFANPHARSFPYGHSFPQSSSFPESPSFPQVPYASNPYLAPAFGPAHFVPVKHGDPGQHTPPTPAYSAPPSLAVPPSLHLPANPPVIPNTQGNQASNIRYSMPVHRDSQSARVARAVAEAKEKSAEDRADRMAALQNDATNGDDAFNFTFPLTR